MNSAVESEGTNVRRVLCEHRLWPEELTALPITPAEGRFVAV